MVGIGVGIDANPTEMAQLPVVGYSDVRGIRGNLPDAVVARIRDVNVSSPIEAESGGVAELICRAAAVELGNPAWAVTIAGQAGAGNGPNPAVGMNFPHAR